MEEGRPNKSNHLKNLCTSNCNHFKIIIVDSYDKMSEQNAGKKSQSTPKKKQTPQKTQTQTPEESPKGLALEVLSGCLHQVPSGCIDIITIIPLRYAAL